MRPYQVAPAEQFDQSVAGGQIDTYLPLLSDRIVGCRANRLSLM
jgi:hypothetical protein